MIFVFYFSGAPNQRHFYNLIKSRLDESWHLSDPEIMYFNKSHIHRFIDSTRILTFLLSFKCTPRIFKQLGWKNSNIFLNSIKQIFQVCYLLLVVEFHMEFLNKGILQGFLKGEEFCSRYNNSLFSSKCSQPIVMERVLL